MPRAQLCERMGTAGSTVAVAAPTAAVAPPACTNHQCDGGGTPGASPPTPTRDEQHEMMINIVTRRHCLREFAGYRDCVLFQSAADLGRARGDVVAKKCAGAEDRWLTCCNTEMRDAGKMESIRYDVFRAPECRTEQRELQLCAKRNGGNDATCVTEREAALLCGLTRLAQEADAVMYAGQQGGKA